MWLMYYGKYVVNEIMVKVNVLRIMVSNNMRLCG